MYLINRLGQEFPHLKPEPLPGDLEPIKLGSGGSATLISKLFTGPKHNIRRARFCQLEVPGKFYAETLVVYPSFYYDLPILGTEFLQIGQKKYFGAVDFHPISTTTDYSSKYLSDFPDPSVSSSKFYDLERFFSPKFWIEKSEVNFYVQYIEKVSQYIVRYKECLDFESPVVEKHTQIIDRQREYDKHMAENDPARGILKAYFSETFAENYIKMFLFNMSK